MAVRPRGAIALAILLALAITASAGTLLAAPSAQATTPVATISTVAVPANAANPDAIQATLPDGKTKIALGLTGLSNVSVGVPVLLKGAATDPTLTELKYTWTLSKPTASKATLAPNNEPTVRFTPDVSGVYKIDLVISSAGVSSPMASTKIRAGEFVGAGAGNCFQCHPAKTQEWSETGHAVIQKWQINGGDDPSASHYNEGCTRCHSTGYYAGTKNGGFADIQQRTSWTFPTLEEITAGKDNWGAMPAELRNVGNIQCENCHGPAKAHVDDSSIKPAVTLDDGVCNVCHDGGGNHARGTELSYAGHSDAKAPAWTYPTGPSRQACVRCHSGAGYVSFIKNPTEQASWDNSVQTAGCSTCHDPHSDANSFQLRIVGKPVEAVGVTKDFGLSATCAECHNARTLAADAVKGSTPHYSPGAELLSDSGGVTYGQAVPNSPHGMIVGATAIKNPSTGASMFGGAAPGPCVTCHMWPTPAAGDPNRYKVGSHSFNVISPDDGFQYLTSCQSCHAGKQNLSEFVAKADYDGNGAAESVQAEVAGMLKLLQDAIGASGIKPIDGHPYFDAADKAKANDKQNNAIYNYLLVRGPHGADGKANAIHNFKRSVALLQLSYKDLTGKDVPNGTIMK